MEHTAPTPFNFHIHRFIIEVLFSASQWSTFAFYVASILDRFIRIEMILPTSKWYRIINYIGQAYSIVFLVCFLDDVANKTLIWFYNVYDYPIYELGAFFLLLKVFSGIMTILLEIVVDVRMLFTSLATHACVWQHGQLATTQQDTIPSLHYHHQMMVRLKYKFFGVFLVLVLFSFAVLATLVAAETLSSARAFSVQSYQVKIDLQTLAIGFLGIQIILGFLLMDSCTS